MVDSCYAKTYSSHIDPSWDFTWQTLAALATPELVFDCPELVPRLGVEKIVVENIKTEWVGTKGGQLMVAYGGFNQPIWKICASQNGFIFSNFRGETLKHIESDWHFSSE